jgi:hypothetical protein
MAANTGDKSARSYKAMCLYQNSRYRRLSDNRSSIRVGSAWVRCGEQLTIGHGPLEHRRLIDSYVIVERGLRRFIRCFCLAQVENVWLQLAAALFILRMDRGNVDVSGALSGNLNTCKVASGALIYIRHEKNVSPFLEGIHFTARGNPWGILMRARRS